MLFDNTIADIVAAFKVSDLRGEQAGSKYGLQWCLVLSIQTRNPQVPPRERQRNGERQFHLFRSRQRWCIGVVQQTVFYF